MTADDETKHGEGDGVPHHLNKAHLDLHIALLHLAAIEDRVGVGELWVVRSLIANAIERVDGLCRKMVH